jgi:hypothetical protein
MAQHVSRLTRVSTTVAVLALAVTAGGCDSAQLLAPTKSTIAISAPTRVLPSGGSTEVSATVLEQAGTPVPNGTTVRFTTSLGRVDPAEAQTRNGVATTTFYAENTSGVARITALSGAASGGDGNTNAVEITIGAAAVNTVTVRANPGGVGPNGGTVELIATVVAENGRSLSNVMVTFTTDQGTLSAANAATDANGEARTQLTTSRASVVSATAGTKTSSTVTVGITSVGTVTLRAIPGSIGPSGGTVELLATIVGEADQPLESVLVTFSADQGTLASAAVRTNSSGEARTMLTTTQQTVVSASAGTKSSGNLTITARVGPNVTISCTPAAGSGNCSAVQATGSNNTATTLFTITRASTSSTLKSASLDFGDSSSVSLGTLTGGTATASHVYAGPTGTTARNYTAIVTATDVNGETVTVSTVVTITPRQTLSVTFTATAATAVATRGQSVAFAATVLPATGGSDLVSEYDWDFGDGFSVATSGANVTHVYTTNGAKTVRLTVRTTDGRSATAQVEVLISGI